MSAPSQIDGLSLTAKQKKRFDLIFKSIEKTEPGSGKPSQMFRATRSWRKTVRPGRSSWEDKPYFRIGRGGLGPVVVLQYEE